MTIGLQTAAYISATVLFILALGGLSNQEKAKRAVWFGIIGMAIAVVATIAEPSVTLSSMLIGAVVIGAVIGVIVANRVEMTGMPQLVAALHSFVGLAAVFIGINSDMSTHDFASQQQLEQTGCIITKRKNLGLCLGAYRDFCCLLNEHKHLCNQVQTLALCNDSTLPIGGHEPFCNDVDSIANNLRTDSSQMEGLTDSVQTTSYHIQTYFLAINACLLQDDCWPEFWEMLNPYGDKDDLIQRGEVGLSQWLLKQGVSINARYSLASILLNQPSANSELNDLDLRQPKEVNTTLMCWKALLKAGFPLIKKQLLLDPPHFLPRAIPMSELSQHLSAKDQKLRSDLEQLMKSRFFKL